MRIANRPTPPSLPRCTKPHRSTITRAVPDDGVDIDALARRLSQEADRLRRQQAPAQQAAPSEGLFGFQAKQAQAEVLAEVGDGGFTVAEFELLSELGRIAVQQLSSDDTGRTQRQETLVIAYTAQYTSGLPYQGPVVTLLKEYLPAAKAVACNELLITSRLTALPGDKWGAATQDLGADPPVVPLLGYFVGGSSEAALAAAGTVEPAQEEALWLVYKWERLLPLAAYPSAKQNTPSFSGLLWLVAQPPDPRALRWGMLRRVTRGMLRALAFCHERGVVHGGVGAGSFLLSTFEDHLASEVVVKLTDFGFARMVTARGAVPSRAEPLAPVDDDDSLTLGQREDMQSLAVVLVETVCAALAMGGPGANPMSADAARRLLYEVFQDSMDEFRGYCLEEPQLVEAVRMLDTREGAGWSLLRAMVVGRPAAELLDHPFVLGNDEIG